MAILGMVVFTQSLLKVINFTLVYIKAGYRQKYITKIIMIRLLNSFDKEPDRGN